ncbi:MAG: hypothetical protein AAGA90_04540 [Actinomycetota bacterium]
MRKVAVALVVLAGSLVVASPVGAGGTWFDTDRDSYEPGDDVTVLAHVGGPGPTLAVHGWLTGLNPWGDNDPSIDPTFEWYLGVMDVHRVDHANGTTTARLSLTFTLPDDLPPGVYGFNHCFDGCDRGFGDLIGAPVAVGVPGFGRELWWPDWEPEIADLPDDVVMRTASGRTAAELRAAGWPRPVDMVAVDTPATPTTPPDASAMFWNVDFDEATDVPSPTTTVAANTTTTAPTTTTTTAAPTTTAVPPTTVTVTTTGATASSGEAAAPAIDAGEPPESGAGGAPVGIVALTVVAVGLGTAAFGFARSTRARSAATSAPAG